MAFATSRGPVSALASRGVARVRAASSVCGPRALGPHDARTGPRTGRRGSPCPASDFTDAEVVAEVPAVPSTALAVDESPKKVSGPTIIVSGGSQGTGLALAKIYAKKGYNVVLAARNEEVLQEAKGAVLRELPAGTTDAEDRVAAVPCDITSPSQVKALAQEVALRFEEVTVLANVAGVCMSGSFEDHSLEDFQSQMDVNFMGAVAVTQAFLPRLRETAKRKGRAHIAVVNSFGGRIPLRNMSAYTASKYALAGWTDVLRAELEGSGIKVTQVQPGVIKSAFMSRAQFRGADGAKAQQSMAQMLENGVPGFTQTPEEVARDVQYGIENCKDEVVVGGVFKAILKSYRLTGANPFAIAPPQ
ncbi:unnamed protein product [Pedinophyceae sp. YPF-701]|nr:unnamed protein product [Pedinophyceae sp. YPF-701]